MTDNSDNSRRNFLKTCVAGTVALGAGKLNITDAAVDTPGKSKVVIARDPKVYDL